MMNARVSRSVLNLVALFVAGSVAVACEYAEAPDAAPSKGPGGPGAAPGPIGTPGGGASAPAKNLPCDVDAILNARCQTCHSNPPKFGASAPLVTWDDLQRPGPGGKKVHESVASRVHDDARPMPPSPQSRLAGKELAVLDAWAKAGAPSSSATCSNTPPPDGVKPLSCKPDTVLKPAKPYVMQAGPTPDQYVCFGVDVNLPRKRHVTAFAPKVDNAKIVHHILLFQANVPVSPDPVPCAAFGSAGWRLVAGWAPGGNNLELPPAAGFPEEAGMTHWVVQVHYNSTSTPSGVDQSGYELCTTETLRPNDAGVLAFGSTNFAIPPRSTHKIRCDYALGPQFANVKLFNASPHMHTRGVAMSTERLPFGGGPAEMIFEQKAFSFEAQANFPITKAVSTGDVMRTRCTWTNPGDTFIRFGEGTGDEMCFDFLGYYPAIPDLTLAGIPIFTWITPSLNAACVTEP